MNPYQYILAPLDFTAKNERALEHVHRLAQPGRTRVCLMHVVEAGAHADDDPLLGFYKSLEENAYHKLVRTAKPFREAGIEIDECVAIGRPARKIVDEAQSSGADLLVLSSHPLGAGSEDPNRWATVSYQAAIFCRCPVLLVK